MPVKLSREDREARFYQPVGTGFAVAAAMQERGWRVVRCERWNPKDDLLQFEVPRTKTDEQFVADLDAAFPDRSFDVHIEDHYYEGRN